MRVTLGKSEVLVTEDVRHVLADAADDTNLTRSQEIRLRYAAVVEFSDDAIIAKTLDGVISAWNPAAERLFGCTQDEAIGQPITMIIPVPLNQSVLCFSSARSSRAGSAGMPTRSLQVS